MDLVAPSAESEFRTSLLQATRAAAMFQGSFEREAFVAEVANRLVSAEELSDWTPCYYQDRGYRRRELLVDGFLIDDFDLDSSVSLILADYSGEDAPDTLGAAQVTSLFDRCLNFIEDAFAGRLHEELEPSTPAYDLARWLFENKASINCVRMFLVTDRPVSKRGKLVAPKTGIDARIEMNIWDVVRLSRAEGSGGREPIEIDLNDFIAGGIPALRAGIGDSGYEAFLCSLPGSVIADLYDISGSRLLEGNVRSFLSAKGGVNKGIRNTIMKEPARFFAYNNGITATATAATVVDRDGLCLIQNLKDLQIVNGGQTTASLFSVRKNDHASLDGVFVQMKLSVVTPETALEIIPKISRYANSQNKVSEADLFSNHPFHRRLEELSRRIWAPAIEGSQQQTHWFYERARAQYVNEQVRLTKAKRGEFLLMNPKSQLLIKTDLGKSENSLRGLPHIVSRGAQKNFAVFADWIDEHWRKDEAQFNDQWFRHAVAKVILFRETEDLISAQTWYAGGYRANIVTYAIAKLAMVIEADALGSSIDWEKIWKRQVLSAGLKSQLAEIAKVAFEVITSPPQGLTNITEWCKRPQCWQNLQDRSIGLRATAKEDLVDFSENLKIARDSKKLRVVDSGLELQTKVLAVGTDQWRALLEWGQANRVLSPTEVSMVELAIRSGRKFVPNPKQAAQLWAAYQRSADDGFSS